MTMSRRIDHARPADFLNIAALDRIAWLHTGEPHIADGEHVWRVWCQYATVLIARHSGLLPDSGDVAGALVMFPTNAGEWFLHKIMVHPDCRGAGLGTLLLQRGLAGADAPVLLTVDPRNEAAVHLYEKFGFTVREHVVGFYRPHEDRYVMAYAV